MRIAWSEIQLTRLKELEADDSELNMQFDGTQARDQAFQLLEKKRGRLQRRKLQELRDVYRRPRLCRLESRLTDILTQNNFVQVTTPTILSKGLLAKMSIDDNHPLTSQIFWLGNDKCLRPMLAPHLYFVLKDLLRLWEKPVRIFEIGSCFRKESQGAQHSNEFTMLNLVEMGLAENKRQARLEELAALVTTAAGVDDYIIQKESSAVYGETIDILAGKGRVEVGSAAMGPHVLDRAWQITDAWMGIGFGLERLLMVAEKSNSLGENGEKFGLSRRYTFEHLILGIRRFVAVAAKTPAKMPVKRYYRKRVELFRLIEKIKLWPSRKGLLHGIKAIEITGDQARITTHCNKTFMITNSRNSRAARWLRNKWFKGVCKTCRVPAWKLEKYSSTYFRRKYGSMLLKEKE